MQLIKHRVNTISELSEVESSWGVEIDLRSDVLFPGRIILSHDPWKMGVDLTDWLQAFKNLKISGPLILNTKEDGLEDRIEELLRQFEINSYFFLDSALPTLIKKVIFENRKNFAIRYSRYEPLNFVIQFSGLTEWVWVDCFQGVPTLKSELEILKDKFKICLVSPELHGSSIAQIENFEEISSLCTAICTKQPMEWKRIYHF